MIHCMLVYPRDNEQGRDRTEEGIEEIEKIKNRFNAYCKSHDYYRVQYDYIYDVEELKARDIVNPLVVPLAQAVDAVQICGIVYFPIGWEKSRTCRIMRGICIEYGIEYYSESEGINEGT